MYDLWTDIYDVAQTTINASHIFHINPITILSAMMIFASSCLVTWTLFYKNKTSVGKHDTAVPPACMWVDISDAVISIINTLHYNQCPPLPFLHNCLNVWGTTRDVFRFNWEHQHHFVSVLPLLAHFHDSGSLTDNHFDHRFVWCDREFTVLTDLISSIALFL